MEAKKAGLIGCGNISDAYLKGAALYQALDIVACADIAPEVAAAKAAAYGIAAQSVDDLLADPELDFVINLTVPNAHADVTLAALAAGRHVYCEKPLAVTLADGRKIAAAAEAAGLRIGCAPDTFLGGAHQRARRLIDEGAIGRPVAATAVFLSPGMESWHPNPTFYFKAGGGPILDVGPYYVATLINLMGPVRRVSASSTITFAERTVTSEGAMNSTKITVDRNPLPADNPLSDVASAHDGRDAILPCNDGTVRKNAANICHQPYRLSKEWRPRWRGRWANQDGVGLHVVKVRRGENDSRGSCNLSWANGKTT